MASLESVLAGIPGIGGFEAARQQNQSQQLGQLQQMGALQKLAAQAQAQQQEQAYRQAMSGLGPNATEEQMLQAARPFMGAGDLSKTVTASKDRQALRDQRVYEIQQRGEQEIEKVRIAAAEKRITQQEADAREKSMREGLARLVASLRPERAPEALEKVVGPDGKPVFMPRSQAAGRTPWSEPTAASQKAATAQRNLGRDLSMAISALEDVSKDGGLIDQSTGSGIGAAVDYTAGLVGAATPGAIAVGKLRPIYDLALKMVPRFEGPQSDKDTLSYNQAAGQLADPKVPNSIKKEAAKTVISLMKKRKEQFTSKDAVGTEADAPGGPVADPLGIR
jgi:hypothetical protein